MNCEICGSELSEAEEIKLFCDKCGSKVGTDEIEEETAANYYPIDIKSQGDNKTADKMYKRFAPLQVIAVLSLLVIFAAVGIFFAVRKDPDEDKLKYRVLVEPSLEVNINSFFSEGLLCVTKKNEYSNQYGFIDQYGEFVIPCEYDYAFSFKEGLAGVVKNRKSGFIDKTGEIVIPMEYDCVYSFNNGIAAAAKNGKWGYINKSGETVIPFEYDDTYEFNSGFAVVVRKNDKWGLIDYSGNVVAPFEYDQIYSYFDGYYNATQNGKNGLIDTAGELIIPCIYDEVNFIPFDGLIYVRQGNKWGILEMKDYKSDPDMNKKIVDRYIFYR